MIKTITFKEQYQHDLNIDKILKEKGVSRIDNRTEFYEWLKKMGNIHLADNEQMDRAFQKVL